MICTQARAQIFETNYDGSSYVLGEYNLDGSAINADLVTGLTAPFYLAQSDSDIFVSGADGTLSEYTTGGQFVTSVDTGLLTPYGVAVSGSNVLLVVPGNQSGFSGSVAEYTTSGSLVNSSFITGLGNPTGIVVSGGDIFIVNHSSGTISEYTTAGTLVNSDLVFGLTNPHGIAISGNDIFVADDLLGGGGVIREYTTSGATVNSALVSGLDSPFGIAAYDGDVFVTDPEDGTVGEYTTSGQAVNADLVSGLVSASGIVVAPEPPVWVLFLTGGLLSLFLKSLARKQFSHALRASLD